MKIFYGYIKSAIYNILRNKAYAIFCILGVCVMFVFITIILQLLNNVVANTKPFVYADKEIHLTTYLDTRGHKIDGIPPEDVPLFLKDIKVYKYCAFHDNQYGNIFVNDILLNTTVSFVNGDYWQINEFNFTMGRPFTEKEDADKNPVAIVKRSFAKKIFKTDQILGQKLVFQNTTYKVIGVVSDYSNFTGNNDCIWVPSSFNQFTPDQSRYFDLYILPQNNIPLHEFKNKIAYSVKNYFKNKSLDISISSEDIFSLKEERIKYLGTNALRYGVPLAIFFLLLIPALNIIVISVANVRNRAEEIAIRRTMGASIFLSFMLLLIENLLLVVTGTILGVLLTIPSANMIDSIFFSGGIYNNISLLATIDYKILLLGIAPMSLLFSFLSGGIPAYLLARRNIATILKGGSEC